ncbi:ABC transporter permease [Rhizobium rhizogenes]|uniref:ABC transporter permease n=1 Tax=Rhizobium rhizogenes TaxID=359 RepID=UPI001EECBDD3|nr:ABC transporter permease subunit [Rhizobium rhizogenes]WEO69923.1 ABC transporter permease subunit [Rhizobium rhizogenes]
MIDYLALMGVGPDGWGDDLAFGALVTLSVAFAGFFIGAVLGSLIAWARIAGTLPVKLLGEGYTTVLRGIPDLLVIYLFYFGGSAALGAILGLFGHQGFVAIPSFAVGAAAIGVVSAAYQAEVFRGSFNALSKDEMEAARAAGMHNALMFRRIIVPQLLRHAIPGLSNVWLLVLKESALVSVTGLAELMRTTQLAAGSTRMPFDFFLFGAVIYLAITFVSTLVFAHLERRSRRGYREAMR